MRFEKIEMRTGDIVLMPFPENYFDCFRLIASDNFRKTGYVDSCWKVIRMFFRPDKYSVLFLFRLCQYRGLLFRLFCHLYKRSCKTANVYLPPMTRVGYGLDLGHEMSVVINGGTIIGNNVSIAHFVSIGTNHDTPAIIGDNVYVGPNSNVIEDVNIGSKVTIGAGTVVTKDIPSNATVVGCPAKVINTDNPARYIKNPYPIP